MVDEIQNISSTQQDVLLSADLMVTVDLQDVRSSLILTVEQDVTAAVLSPVKTAQKVDRSAAYAARYVAKRILLQQVLQTNVRFSFPMQSVLLNRLLSM